MSIYVYVVESSAADATGKVPEEWQMQAAFRMRGEAQDYAVREMKKTGECGQWFYPRDEKVDLLIGTTRKYRVVDGELL